MSFVVFLLCVLKAKMFSSQLQEIHNINILKFTRHFLVIIA